MVEYGRLEDLGGAERKKNHNQSLFSFKKYLYLIKRSSKKLKLKYIMKNFCKYRLLANYICILCKQVLPKMHSSH